MQLIAVIGILIAKRVLIAVIIAATYKLQLKLLSKNPLIIDCIIVSQKVFKGN